MATWLGDPEYYRNNGENYGKECGMTWDNPLIIREPVRQRTLLDLMKEQIEKDETTNGCSSKKL